MGFAQAFPVQRMDDGTPDARVIQRRLRGDQDQRPRGELIVLYKLTRSHFRWNIDRSHAIT
jgi:hypothetical protein